MSRTGGEVVVEGTQVESATEVHTSASATHVQVEAVAVHQHVVVHQHQSFAVKQNVVVHHQEPLPGPIRCNTRAVAVEQEVLIQPSGPVQRNPRIVEPDDDVDCNQCCCMAWKFLGMMCWIICPPVPELMTRKIAFHPPQRGSTYRIRGIAKKTRETREVYSLMEYKLMDEIWLYPMLSSKDSAPEAWIREATKTFVVQSRSGSLLVGLWVYSPTCAGTKEKKVILFSGGNSADLGVMIHGRALLTMAIAFSADVVAYDYSGYGYSTGTASEKNIYMDEEAMFEHVKQQRGNDVQIILLGYSMGTAAAVDLASKRPDNLVGVILVAAFTSGMRVMYKKPDDPQSFWLDRFRSVDKASEMNVPTLLIHGNRDEVVPIEHSYALYRKLTKPVKPLYIPSADHDDILCMGPRHYTVALRISNFVAYETAGSESSRSRTQALSSCAGSE